MNRTSPIGVLVAIAILALCAAAVQPALAKGAGHASHSFKAPKAPKAEVTKAEPTVKAAKRLPKKD